MQAYVCLGHKLGRELGHELVRKLGKGQRQGYLGVEHDEGGGGLVAGAGAPHGGHHAAVHHLLLLPRPPARPHLHRRNSPFLHCAFSTSVAELPFLD